MPCVPQHLTYLSCCDVVSNIYVSVPVGPTAVMLWCFFFSPRAVLWLWWVPFLNHFPNVWVVYNIYANDCPSAASLWCCVLCPCATVTSELSYSDVWSLCLFHPLSWHLYYCGRYCVPYVQHPYHSVQHLSYCDVCHVCTTHCLTSDLQYCGVVYAPLIQTPVLL